MLCLSVRAQLLRNRTLCPTYTCSRCISFGNGACVCVHDYICSELRRECRCAKCTDRYANMILWVCERAHLCLFSRVPLKECHRLQHSSLCCDYSQNEPLEVGELDNRPTYRRLFGRGRTSIQDATPGAFGGCDHRCLLPVFSGAECLETKEHTVYPQC